MATVPMDNLPSNSHKSQQNAASGQNGRPEIPVFEGETKQARRKTGGFWRWMKRMFLSDRTPKEIMKEIVEFRIVPGIKDNFRNSAMATLDSFIYPGSSAGPVSTQSGINYNKVYNNSGAPRAVSQPAKDTKTDEINRGFGNPCFKSQQEAMNFLSMMKSYDYPTLSVHTMYMMQRKHIDYTWDAYGWNREEILALGVGAIRHISDPDWPWMIELPEAHLVA